MEWEKHSKVKCDCGHYPKDHYDGEGACKKCACTWYYPNYKYILQQRLRRKQMPTDKERLDFLQELTNKKAYTGQVILRDSTTGRGWRLHETYQEGSSSSVRDAIDAYMRNNN